MGPKIYSIGHSTRTAEQFLALLKMNEIAILADVRAYPGSRKFPQFNRESMIQWLSSAGIKYEHMNALGGRRHSILSESPNRGWRSPQFQSYADYALSDEWQRAFLNLIHLAEEQHLAYMCAERHPSMCHRSVISDWMVAKGVEVWHIVDEITLQQHQPGRWGATPVFQDGKVTYPADILNTSQGAKKRSLGAKKTKST
jgi:uncharacterized protein (DUF488 family)